MTDLILRACEPHTLLSHLTAYGLAAILEQQGAAGVGVGWTAGSNPRPFVAGPDEHKAAELIARHARAADTEGSWTNRDIVLKGSPRGLHVSPRLTPFGDSETWTQVQQLRQEVLDALTASGAWLDLRLIAALGEPCYWRYNTQGAPLQDDAASRLEMQPRNQGSEFVGNRLRNSRRPSQPANPVRSSPDCAGTLSGMRSVTTSQTAAPPPGSPAQAPQTTPWPGAPCGGSPSSRWQCGHAPRR